jgi:alkyldihydroxyacetonephosphate synthase
MTGATVAMKPSILLDTKRLNKVLSLEPENGVVEVESGIVGVHLEEFLYRHGWTLGHVPESLLSSTPGAWIATRSAGQMSSSYGAMDRMLEALQVATDDGEVRWLRRDPALVPLLVGSEGMLGCVTAARLRIHPAPLERRFRGVVFPDIQQGWDAVQEIMQGSLRPPALLRLTDTLGRWLQTPNISRWNESEAQQSTNPMESLPRPFRPTASVSSRLPVRPNPVRQWFGSLQQQARSQTSTLLRFSGTLSQIAERLLPNETLLIMGVEGYEEGEAEQLMEHVLQLCKDLGGRDVGPGPGWHWWRNRFATEFQKAPIFAKGSFRDSFDVAASWNHVPHVYSEVRKALQQEAMVTTLLAHPTAEGCSLQFTFTATPSPREDELVMYDRIWGNALDAAWRAGGSLSHHHGVGLGKARFVPSELGEGGMRLLGAVQKAFSPGSTMNPGKFSLTGGNHG